MEYKPRTSFDSDSEIKTNEEFSLNDVSLIIERGNKRLTLDFFDWPQSSFIHAQTKLKKLEDGQKVPKDTTWVYRRALEMMQGVANYYSRPVMYLFYPPSRKTSSVSSRMKAKKFSLRRDFAPDEAWGEDTPGVSPWELHTTNSGLAHWAVDVSRGASVFDWDSKIVADRFYCLKIIEPA